MSDPSSKRGSTLFYFGGPATAILIGSLITDLESNGPDDSSTIHVFGPILIYLLIIIARLAHIRYTVHHNSLRNFINLINVLPVTLFLLSFPLLQRENSYAFARFGRDARILIYLFMGGARMAGVIDVCDDEAEGEAKSILYLILPTISRLQHFTHIRTDVWIACMIVVYTMRGYIQPLFVVRKSLGAFAIAWPLWGMLSYGIVGCFGDIGRYGIALAILLYFTTCGLRLFDIIVSPELDSIQVVALLIYIPIYCRQYVWKRGVSFIGVLHLWTTFKFFTWTNHEKGSSRSMRAVTISLRKLSAKRENGEHRLDWVGFYGHQILLVGDRKYGLRRPQAVQENPSRVKPEYPRAARRDEESYEYHEVGWTYHTDEEIERVCRDVEANLHVHGYSKVFNNCGHFVGDVARRIVYENSWLAYVMLGERREQMMRKFMQFSLATHMETEGIGTFPKASMGVYALLILLWFGRWRRLGFQPKYLLSF